MWIKMRPNTITWLLCRLTLLPPNKVTAGYGLLCFNFMYYILMSFRETVQNSPFTNTICHRIPSYTNTVISDAVAYLSNGLQKRNELHELLMSFRETVQNSPFTNFLCHRIPSYTNTVISVAYLSEASKTVIRPIWTSLNVNRPFPRCLLPLFTTAQSGKRSISFPEPPLSLSGNEIWKRSAIFQTRAWS